MKSETISLYECALRISGRNPSNPVTNAKALSRLDILIEAVNNGDLEGWHNETSTTIKPFTASRETANEVFVSPGSITIFIENLIEKSRQDTRGKGYLRQFYENAAKNDPFAWGDIVFDALKRTNALPEVHPNIKQKGNEAAKKDPLIHSRDYRSVSLHGKNFSLTKLQAEVIKILHQNYKEGHSGIGGDTILTELDSESSKLKDIFRSRRGAWEDLIASDNKGVFRLNL